MPFPIQLQLLTDTQNYVFLGTQTFFQLTTRIQSNEQDAFVCEILPRCCNCHSPCTKFIFLKFPVFPHAFPVHFTRFPGHLNTRPREELPGAFGAPLEGRTRAFGSLLKYSPRTFSLRRVPSHFWLFHHSSISCGRIFVVSQVVPLPPPLSRFSPCASANEPRMSSLVTRIEVTFI